MASGAESSTFSMNTHIKQVLFQPSSKRRRRKLGGDGEKLQDAGLRTEIRDISALACEFGVKVCFLLMEMNFTDLLNSTSLNDLNDPPPIYDLTLSQYHSSGSPYEQTCTTEVHTDDRIKAEHFKLLLANEQEQVALRKKEIELQTRSEDAKIMSMDISKISPLQAEYFISLQREILAKRASMSGSD